MKGICTVYKKSANIRIMVYCILLNDDNSIMPSLTVMFLDTAFYNAQVSIALLL